MSDQKTHTIQLGNAPKEEVTAKELEAVKQATGPRFAQYEVQVLQPKEPADLTAAPKSRAVAAPAAATTTETK
jgi:protein-disulfide isomerase-like protein with CxxC motif